MRCERCGAPIGDDQRFCPYCGMEITRTAAKPAGAEPELTQPGMKKGNPEPELTQPGMKQGYAKKESPKPAPETVKPEMNKPEPAAPKASEAPKKSKKGLLIGLLAGGLAVIAAVVVLLVLHPWSKNSVGSAKEAAKPAQIAETDAPKPEQQPEIAQPVNDSANQPGREVEPAATPAHYPFPTEGVPDEAVYAYFHDHVVDAGCKFDYNETGRHAAPDVYLDTVKADLTEYRNDGVYHSSFTITFVFDPSSNEWSVSGVSSTMPQPEMTPVPTPALTPVPVGSYMNVALITDYGRVDDKSFNQGAWEGVVAFCEAAGMKQGEGYNYYRPSEDSTEARVETIGTAIRNGANVIVCPGYLFEEAIYLVQDANPDVMFLLLDGEPHDANYQDYKTAANTHNVFYKVEQAGFLAGYAAVKDGYTKLGFIGGMAVPDIIRYGYGFVQGANTAAQEMGVADRVSVKFAYANRFYPSDDLQNRMKKWYSDGTEVVFACGGGIYLSVVAAANEKGGKVIGIDVDQSAEGDCIITSAMKGLSNSVVLALADLAANDGRWSKSYAGKTAVLGVADDCVGLPTAEGSWRFNRFTVDEYYEIYREIEFGHIAVINDTSYRPAVSISVDYQS